MTVSPIRDDDGNVIGASTIARDITERNRADLERPLLLEAERAARAEAEAATERLTYLAEASTVLSGSLDYQATLNRLADIAERLAGARRLLVATDYDGTLTPIVTRPERARLSPTSRRCSSRSAPSRPPSGRWRRCPRA